MILEFPPWRIFELHQNVRPESQEKEEVTFFLDVGWFLLVICVAHNNLIEGFQHSHSEGDMLFFVV